MKFSREERKSLLNNNINERKARRKEWNRVVRYCEDCFYLLEENEVGASHPPGGCRQAQLNKKPINPKMYKILKERKKTSANGA